jgi:5'-methylthioadenosine phosphorylase
LQSSILKVAKEQNIHIHKDCTYVCIEGPRFSTKAESKFYRTTGADIIGMTLVPECQLAREAQMCYINFNSNDYDVWAENQLLPKRFGDIIKNVEGQKSSYRLFKFQKKVVFARL